MGIDEEPVMNLYDLHPDPEKAPGYEQRLQVPQIALEKALENYKIHHKPSPELESVIAKDPYSAYTYADKILKKRFIEGEPVIAQSPIYAFYYTLGPYASGFTSLIIRKRFRLGEPAIAKNRKYARMYNDFFGTDI